MEKYVLLKLSFILSSVLASDMGCPKDTKQYRKDYVYNRKTDAFYKLHIESRHGRIIRDVCRTEGAELMNPQSNDDILQLHIMFKSYPDLGDYVWVANDGGSYESAEEQPIINLNPENEWDLSEKSSCTVMTRDGDIKSMKCYRSLPFICKVNARDAPYDPHCQVFAQDYKYYATVGSCYKIHCVAYTWSEAYAECNEQGAHLVVLNSETEREILKDISLAAPGAPGSRGQAYYLAGFRSLPAPAPIEFKTIFNQTLAEAGFSQWSPSEPNNMEGREFCGSIYKYDGLLNDVECLDLYGFICEKEIKYI